MYKRGYLDRGYLADDIYYTDDWFVDTLLTYNNLENCSLGDKLYVLSWKEFILLKLLYYLSSSRNLRF